VVLVGGWSGVLGEWELGGAGVGVEALLSNQAGARKQLFETYLACLAGQHT